MPEGEVGKEEEGETEEQEGMDRLIVSIVVLVTWCVNVSKLTKCTSSKLFKKNFLKPKSMKRKVLWLS